MIAPVDSTRKVHLKKWGKQFTVVIPSKKKQHIPPEGKSSLKVPLLWGDMLVPRRVDEPFRDQIQLLLHHQAKLRLRPWRTIPPWRWLFTFQVIHKLLQGLNDIMSPLYRLKIDVKDAPKPKSMQISFSQVSCRKKKHIQFMAHDHGPWTFGIFSPPQWNVDPWSHESSAMRSTDLHKWRDEDGCRWSGCKWCNWHVLPPLLIFIFCFFWGGAETIDFNLSLGLCPLLMFWHWCEVRTVEKIECLNDV